MPMDDMFWGDYFGSFVDKFGVCWMINFPIQNKPDETYSKSRFTNPKPDIGSFEAIVIRTFDKIFYFLQFGYVGKRNKSSLGI